MLKQRTLKTTIKTTGVGVHTGARVDLVLRPAPPDTGIVFHRVDLPTAVAIPADARHVGDTRLSSTLKQDGASISTVEHVMSALAGLGIDNVRIDVAGPEIPTGRQRGAVRVPAAVGRDRRAECPEEIPDYRPVRRSTRRRQVGAPDPFYGFKLDFTIDFPHPMFGSENRQVVIDFAEHSYVKSGARADVRLHGDVEAMRAAGLDSAAASRTRLCSMISAC
jgi:UDP-3-O-[3-hydroxymyristoyl] N-acetylglucosamine deacetylase